MHAPHSLTTLLLFRAAGMLLGVDVRNVREVLRATMPEAPFHDSGCLIGIITVRGRCTPVVDMNMQLGAPAIIPDRKARMISAHYGEAAACLLVEEVKRLYEAEPDDLAPSPLVIEEMNIRWFKGVVHTAEGDMATVIDLASMLSPPTVVVDKEGVNV